MKIILRNSAMGFVSFWLYASRAVAMSHGAIDLEIKQIDGKPAACLPMSDDRGSDPVQIQGVGVSRRTGLLSPVVMYWDLDIPASAQPVYLKRGECLVDGQTVAGAIVHTQPKTLDLNKIYSFSIIPVGNGGGPVYGAGFCVLKQANGGARIAEQGKDQNPCASIGF